MNHLTCSATLIQACLLFQAAGAADTYCAFTEPVHRVQVSAAEPGRVARVLVKRGDRVAAGDLIVVQDLEVWEATRRAAQKKADSSARSEALEVEAAVAEDRLKALGELLEAGAGNPEEVRRAEADVKIARLNIEAAREHQELAALQLAEIEARLEQRRIRSPVPGVVVDLLKESGEFVAPSNPHVATVVQLDQLRATYYLPTATALDFAAGETVQLQMPGHPGTVAGAIEYVAPVTDAESGRVRVDVLIDNAAGGIRCGARCLLKVSPQHDAAERADDT